MRSFFKIAANEENMESQSIPIYICRPEEKDKVLSSLSETQKIFANQKKFKGDRDQVLDVTGLDGVTQCILFGVGDMHSDDLGPIRTGHLSTTLAPGLYKLAVLPADWSPELAATGWGLGAYKFDRYLQDQKVFPVLDISDVSNADEILAIAESIHLGRDLINTPPNDMGPEALEDAARATASRYSANIRVTTGLELLDQNFPMIHAVGRAAHEEPRLVELEWGNPEHPRLALIGKGITFDTGGVNIKSASSARIMKKDMGGAAHALALAQMVMANDLPVRLHLLLAIAENSVSAGAYRPGDILTSRIGKTVEIDNTDAEGRLVLGDALTRAAEDKPKLMIDFATLTGAARVALGPTLPPFFCNRKDLVEGVMSHTDQAYDPVWNMPLWDPYFKLLSSPIADMKNAGGGFAGCITAALFLKEFVSEVPWMHFDVYGWNPSSNPGHPAGGEMFAIRGLYDWIKTGAFAEISS